MQPSIPFKQKIGGLIQLFRPELPIAAAICVLIGEVLALGSIPPLPMIALGFACGFFLSASALITNDYFDLEVDKINAPQRPIPSGRVSPSTAMITGIIVGLIGLAIALVISPFALGLGLILWSLGFLYNWKLKGDRTLGQPDRQYIRRRDFCSGWDCRR